MAFPLSNYIKIKNRYCIAYFGNCNEYIVQLLLVRPSIEAALPGIEIHLCCKDRVFHLLHNEPNVIPESQIRERKWEFTHIKELTYGMNGIHPVEALLKECQIPVVPIERKPLTESKYCVIVPEGALPTGSLSDSQVKQLIAYARDRGYSVSNQVDWRDAGWVVGVESEQLFLAGSKGIRTALVQTGVGQGLYKSLFPEGEILSSKFVS